MLEADTHVSFDGERILINGSPTYPGTAAEGLLYNVRTVNATFDDTLGKVDWWDDDGTHAENDCAGYGVWKSPDSAFANTERYIEGLPDYKAWGVLAVNLCFQGGHPLNAKPWIPEGKGSAGARPSGHRDFYHNSGFHGDGSLDDNHAARMASIIEACDRLGMVAIVELFYFGQDPVFRDEGAVLRATENGVDFLCERNYGNVILEIGNEIMQGHFHHDILKPGRVAELIHLAKKRARDVHGRDLLVSTSEAALLNVPKQWTWEQIDIVYEASDCVLLHGGDDIDHGKVGDTSIVVDKIEYIRDRPWFKESPRPIIFNESDGDHAFDAAARRNVSFGLHSGPHFQTMFPPKWGVWKNGTTWFFERVKARTGAPGTEL